MFGHFLGHFAHFWGQFSAVLGPFWVIFGPFVGQFGLFWGIFWENSEKSTQRSCQETGAFYPVSWHSVPRNWLERSSFVSRIMGGFLRFLGVAPFEKDSIVASKPHGYVLHCDVLRAIVCLDGRAQKPANSAGLYFT